jgi:hypothetical protein
MSSKYLKVEDDNTIVRDTSSNGIINIDNNSYLLHKKKKELARKQLDVEVNRENRINNIEQKLANLEGTMTKILDILTNGKS